MELRTCPCLLVAQADVTNEMQRHVLSQEPLGSLLQDEVSLGRLPARDCACCPDAGAAQTPAEAQASCPALPPLPAQALGLPWAGVPHYQTQTLLCNPQNAHTARFLADGGATSCWTPMGPTPGDVTSSPTGGLARVTWLALVTVC